MSKWYEVRAAGKTAEITLRGYIGAPAKGYDYWSGEEVDLGGAGTVQEFEAALTALGPVDVIHVYLTSEGGNVTDGIAIHNILARQTARVICTVDGYAFSIATVIAMAADEVRVAGNGLWMIHDAEFWASGSDVRALQEAIDLLTTCNDAIAAAYQAKAGGTLDEWHERMNATTWLTGAQAAELRLADVVLADVALTAFAPLKSAPAAVTALASMPEDLRARIDKATPATCSHPKPTDIMLRNRTAPATAAATASIEDEEEMTTATPPSAEAPEDEEVTNEDHSDEEDDAKAKAKAKDEVTDEDDDEDEVTARVKAAVTAALKPLQKTITAQATELERLKGLVSHGVGSATAASSTPAGAGAANTTATIDVKAMNPLSLLAAGRAAASATATR
jgi:ATP-dependent Clp protease protease subunit